MHAVPFLLYRRFHFFYGLCAFRFVKLIFALGYDDGGDSVSDQVDDRPSFTHKAVDAEEQRQPSSGIT